MIRSTQLFLSLLCIASNSSAMMTNFHAQGALSGHTATTSFAGNGITQCQLPTPLQEINTHASLIAAIDNREIDTIISHFDSWMLRFFNTQGCARQLEVALNHAVTLPNMHSGQIVAYLLSKIQQCSVQHAEHLLHQALNNGHLCVIEYMKKANPSLLQATLMTAVNDRSKAHWFDALNQAVMLTPEQKKRVTLHIVIDLARGYFVPGGYDKKLQEQYEKDLAHIRAEEREQASRLSMDDTQELANLPCHPTTCRNYIGLCVALCPFWLAPLMKGLEYLQENPVTEPNHNNHYKGD